MSFKCEECGKVAKSGEKSFRKVVETRNVQYRNSAGTEIVKEQMVCAECKGNAAQPAKRVQDLVHPAIGTKCRVGEFKQSMNRPEGMSSIDFLAMKAAQNGCPATCSCTHIGEKTNKIFGKNI